MLNKIILLNDCELNSKSLSKHVLVILLIIAKIKVAVSVDKQRTLIRIYTEKYNSV